MDLSRIVRKIKGICALVRVEITFLVTPFAIIVPFMALNEFPDLKKMICLFIASTVGFYCGNIFNGFADMDIDKDNPRTSGRPMVMQSVSKKEAIALIGLSGLIIVFCTWMIDWFFLFLLPIPMVISLVYSLTKRVTWLCHFILATVQAMIPVAAWLIFRSIWDFEWILIGGSVFLWAAAFELLYSIQDVEYDRSVNLHSVPVRFGVKNTILMSLAMHILSLIFLFLFAYFVKAGIFFYVGCAIGALMFAYEFICVLKNSSGILARVLAINQLYNIELMVFAVLDFYYR